MNLAIQNYRSWSTLVRKITPPYAQYTLFLPHPARNKAYFS